jgi:antitoxin component of MazEF toxin-antitoxin module
MTSFKAKLRIIGNSIGIYVPRDVITGFKVGDEIEFDVITKSIEDVITPVRKTFDTDWCNKHTVMKGSCGCK